jgi:hypothetical protein
MLPEPGSRYAYASEIDKCPKIIKIARIETPLLNFIIEFK